MEDQNLSSSNTISSEDQSVNKPLIKYAWLRVLLFFIAWIVISSIAQVVTMLILGLPLTSSLDVNSLPSVAIQLVTMVITLLMVLLFCQVFDNRPMKTLGFSLAGNKLNHLISGMIWGVGLMTIIYGILYFSGNITIINIEFKPEVVLSSLFLFAIVAINEEVMTRGYMLNNLMSSHNKYLSLAIVAAIFSVLHLFNAHTSVFSTINIFLAGFVLGIYYIHQKNLWFPIGMHFTWNFFQGSVYGIAVSGTEPHGIITSEVSGSELLTGGEFGLEGSLIGTFLIIIAMIIIHFLYKEKKTTPISSDDLSASGPGKVL